MTQSVFASTAREQKRNIVKIAKAATTIVQCRSSGQCKRMYIILELRHPRKEEALVVKTHHC